MWLRLEDAQQAELAKPTVTGVHLEAPRFGFAPANGGEAEVWLADDDDTEWDDPEAAGHGRTALTAQHYRILVEAITRAQSRHVNEAGVDLGELFEDLLHVLLMLTESEYGYIGEVLYHENGDPYLRTYAITDISWSEATRNFYREHSRGRPGVGLEFTNLKSLFGRVMVSGKAVISNHPGSDPRRGGLPPGHPPLNCYLGLPFYSGKTMVGTIGVANKKGGYTADIVHFLKPFLLTCGNLITSARITAASNLAQQQRQLAEERLEIAAHAARIGLWFVAFDPLVDGNQPNPGSPGAPDLNNSTVYFSPELGGLLEERNQEYRGPLSQLLHSRVHPSDKSRWDFAWAEHIRRNSPFDLEVRLIVNPSGKFRWFQIRGQVNRDEHGNPVRMAGSLIDVTQLVEAREEALEASRVKSQFLATISHEIRTPMTSILGMTSLVLESTNPPLDPDHRELIGAAHESATSLLRILDDLLDLSRIEAGKMDLQPHPFSLRRLVKDALVPFLTKSKEKNLQLAVSVSDEIHDRVLGDSTRLRQIIVNLVGNAIKFTRKGRVAISVDLPDPSTRPMDVRFTVEDTGIGIPQSKLLAIFEPFTQADGTMSRVFGGTGLGLSISRDLVTRMGGRLEVRSEEGHGSTFSFTVVLVPLATPGTPGEADGQFQSGEAAVSAAGGFFEKIPKKPEGDTISISRPARSPGESMLPAVLPPESRKFPSSEPPKTSTESPFASLEKKMSPNPRPAQLTQPAPLSHPNDSRPLRILLAEDNPVNQRLVERILQKVGHRVVSVANGQEAVDAYLTSIGAPVSSPTVTFPVSAARSSDSIIPGLPTDQGSVPMVVERAGSDMSQLSEASGGDKVDPENQFDVILMDVQMPELDGHSATRLIREYEANILASANPKRRAAGRRRMPIIALTANAMKGDEEICLAAGMDRFIPKPIDANKLKRTIAEVASDPSFLSYYPMGGNG